MSFANLPNLFLADLGEGLTLTPATIQEACHAISRNRDRWLRHQRARMMIELIAHVAERWLDPEDGFRKLALSEGSRELSLGIPTLTRGLDGFFKLLTIESLEALVTQDLGEVKRLDDFVSATVEMRAGRSSWARGPRLMAHIIAGNLPNPALMSMVLGLLTKSAQFLKCPSNGSIIPRLFAHSLAQVEPKVGSCMELATWHGGNQELESALFAEVDCVTATGSDEMIQSVRARIPSRVRLVGYGHKVSFSFVGNDYLSTYAIKRVVRDAANDITAWNQMGCLSPHVIYVQEDGVTAPQGFAQALAEELELREKSEPRGEISLEESAAIATRRAAYRLRSSVAAPPSAESDRADSVFRDLPIATHLWHSEESTAWTVVYDSDPRFLHSCLNRFIYIKPVRKFSDVLHFAEPIRHLASTVAIATMDTLAVEYARQLADWGATRVCPVGRMQEPALAWRHDGRPALGELVTWTDFEQ
ncbi:MAG TPA: acyl-CoA reductase [Candidatus Limnocylindria bacterium]|jgi:hypothetical protein|nr:acyl-CoA reductase [Candidatus Limnocylindria bacterium]